MPCPQPCLFKVKTESQKSAFWKLTIINMRPKLKRNRKFKKSQKRYLKKMIVELKVIDNNDLKFNVNKNLLFM